MELAALLVATTLLLVWPSNMIPSGISLVLADFVLVGGGLSAALLLLQSASRMDINDAVEHATNYLSRLHNIRILRFSTTIIAIVMIVVLLLPGGNRVLFGGSPYVTLAVAPIILYVGELYSLLLGFAFWSPRPLWMARLHVAEMLSSESFEPHALRECIKYVGRLV